MEHFNSREEAIVCASRFLENFEGATILTKRSDRIDVRDKDGLILNVYTFTVLKNGDICICSECDNNVILFYCDGNFYERYEGNSDFCALNDDAVFIKKTGFNIINDSKEATK